MIKVTNNLTFLYSYFAVLPPPTKLELTLAGKAKEQQWEREGTYILVDSLVNGYPNWLKSDGSQAIWFNKVTSSWFVDYKEYLGSNTGGIGGPKGKESYPNEIKQGWEYANESSASQDAGPNDVIFKSIGTFFKPLLYKINSKFFPLTKQHKHLSNKIQNPFEVLDHEI